MTNKTLTTPTYNKLLKDLSAIILANKKSIEQFASSQLALTYWQVGKRIEEEKLATNANYYSNILSNLSEDLSLEKSTLTRSLSFFKIYTKQPEISNLTWSHYKSLIAIKNDKLRSQIEEKTKNEGWTVAKMKQEIISSQSNVIANSGKLNQNQDVKKITRPKNPDYLYKAKIIDVVDGDTLILNIDLGFQVIKEQRVRLNQINAPELKTKAGKKSKNYLLNLAANLNKVTVKTNKIDIYGRYLVDLFYLNENENRKSQSYFFEHGVYLSEELVRVGMADIY